MMNNDTISVKSRDRGTAGVGRTFLRAAYELAIRRAGRDAHRTGCVLDAAECPICREHAGRIAEAKAALCRDPLAGSRVLRGVNGRVRLAS
jgi:hypothetical protein